MPNIHFSSNQCLQHPSFLSSSGLEISKVSSRMSYPSANSGSEPGGILQELPNRFLSNRFLSGELAIPEDRLLFAYLAFKMIVSLRFHQGWALHFGHLGAWFEMGIPDGESWLSAGFCRLVTMIVTWKTVCPRFAQMELLDLDIIKTDHEMRLLNVCPMKYCFNTFEFEVEIDYLHMHTG